MAQKWADWANTKQASIARMEQIFKEWDKYGPTGPEPKKISLRISKKYRTNISASSSQGTASPEANDENNSSSNRWIMSHTDEEDPGSPDIKPLLGSTDGHFVFRRAPMGLSCSSNNFCTSTDAFSPASAQHMPAAQP